MDALVKILLMDEKKIAQLTLLYNELKGNIEAETRAEKEARILLGADIVAIKKTNAVIVRHFLKEHILSLEEINTIMISHMAA